MYQWSKDIYNQKNTDTSKYIHNNNLYEDINNYENIILV